MRGIDISHHQGLVNFQAIKTNNTPAIDFIYMKATQGTGYTDTALKFNSFEAKKAGFKIGYYHYATLNSENVEQDARDEANYFISVISKLPAFDMPLVLDIEENKVGLGRAEVERWIKTFFAELEAKGYKDYVLYSYTPFLNTSLPANHSFGSVRLWIAAYVNKPAPLLPAGWSNAWLWQYSAKGKVAGIKGDCDMNKSLD